MKNVNIFIFVILNYAAIEPTLSHEIILIIHLIAIALLYLYCIFLMGSLKDISTYISQLLIDIYIYTLYIRIKSYDYKICSKQPRSLKVSKRSANILNITSFNLNCFKPSLPKCLYSSLSRFTLKYPNNIGR